MIAIEFPLPRREPIIETILLLELSYALTAIQHYCFVFLNEREGGDVYQGSLARKASLGAFLFWRLLPTLVARSLGLPGSDCAA